MSADPFHAQPRDAQAHADEPAPLTDAAIIGQVVAGDVAAFEPLMRRYNQRLFRVARSVMNNDADAEEVLQEAYIQGFTRLRQLSTPDAFATWMTKITLNEAYARLRAKRPLPVDRDELSAASTTEAMASAAGMVSATGPVDPARTTEARQLCAILERAVADLPEHYRTVLILRSVEGLSVTETAECLAIPADTVKTRLFRARAELERIVRVRANLSLPQLFEFGFQRCDRIVQAVLGALELQRRRAH